MSDTPSNEPSTPTVIRRFPFDALFFSGFLGERTRALCAQQPDRIPVVLLHLADGSVLDLCHIEHLSPEWVGVMVYRDAKRCDRMDLVLVPYPFITRVDISLASIYERRIGFQMKDPAK